MNFRQRYTRITVRNPAAPAAAAAAATEDSRRGAKSVQVLWIVPPAEVGPQASFISLTAGGRIARIFTDQILMPLRRRAAEWFLNKRK